MLNNNVISKPSPEMQKRIEHIPPGGNIRNLPKRLLPPRFKKHGLGKDYHTGHSILRRLTLTGTAPTILASTGDDSHLIHPVENRFLSLREKARLQTFPDSYLFIGSYCAVLRQIGNAVPVRMARQLARALKEWTI